LGAELPLLQGREEQTVKRRKPTGRKSLPAEQREVQVENIVHLLFFSFDKNLNDHNPDFKKNI